MLPQILSADRLYPLCLKRSQSENHTQAEAAVLYCIHRRPTLRTSRAAHESVQARPTPEKDSSSESENSAADGETNDDEYYEARSSNARSAHVLVLGCNMSEKEVRRDFM
jgi:hypothetical protein